MNFLVSELIRKKRDGETLSNDELHFLVTGFSAGSIPDYQISAWLMAAYLKGLNKSETLSLTRLMKESGESLNWRALSSSFASAKFADKHSTGGVGDKVSLVLAPLAACLDLKVPMMSGRGLGHTGGTVDKLQAIPGFNIFLSKKQMIESLETTGICMMAQSAELCPADKKLYALRDVTSTIENIPLITASIVSKKWAEGIDAIVFDVKCGDAAFMSNLENAKSLAHSLVETAEGAGLRAHACITRMEEPLGAFIGNALEVKECVFMLTDTYPTPRHRELCAPLLEITLTLTARMALLAGTRSNFNATREECRQNLKNGKAWELFKKMCRSQGVHELTFEKLARPATPPTKEFLFFSKQGGVIQNIHSKDLGLAGIEVGAGRKTTDGSLDPAVGFEMMVSRGERVEKHQPLLRAHIRTETQFAAIQPYLSSCFDISEAPPAHSLNSEIDSLLLLDVRGTTAGG